MGTTLVKAQVIDQSLQITSKPKIASGGVDETIIEWAFCELWEGFTKTAIFYMNENTPYYALISDDNLCTIPHEAVANDGVLNFGVFGADPDGVVRTSEIARYKIVKGAITEGLQPSDPTPELWEQMLTKAEEILQREVAFENANRLEIDPDSENWILGGKDTGMLARSSRVYFKWSAAMPTKNSDMKDEPDAYIGVYVGKETGAPTDYTVYKWYCYKGDAVSLEQIRQEITAMLSGAAVVISYTQITADAYSVEIPLPSGYKAYRLKASIQLTSGNSDHLFVRTNAALSYKTAGYHITTGAINKAEDSKTGMCSYLFYDKIGGTVDLIILRNGVNNSVRGAMYSAYGYTGFSTTGTTADINKIELGTSGIINSVEKTPFSAGSTFVLEGIV